MSLPIPVSNTADRINEHMKATGGQALRHSMREGRAQFWVVMKDGKTLAGSSLWNLQRALGLTYKAPDSDWIPRAKAAKLSGYSTTALSRAARDGEIESRGVRPQWLLRTSVEVWAAKHRAKGGQFLPRVRRKPPRAAGIVGTPKPRVVTAATGQIEHGIPMPAKRSANTLWADMKVGDSVFSLTRKWPPARLGEKGWRFAVRTWKQGARKGWRIWRVK